MSYTHLHRHSEYSLLDGLGTAQQYAARAAELGQGALALTDHGSLSGALHHISACTGKDRKGNKLHDPLVPISGVEAYFRPDRALAKKFKQRKSFHLCLYAKNLKGWHNLLSIVSTSYAEVEDGGGFYDDPCIDWELLERHREGLACSSACISSWLSHLIQNGESVAVDDYIDRMLNLFGEDFWLEIMPHAFDGQVSLNREIVKIAQTRSIPLLATNDAHFPYKEWAETHRVAKILGSSSSFSKVEKDIENGKASYLADLNPTLYLAHEEEMRSWFQCNHPAIPENLVDESIKNTQLFTQRITPFLLDKTNKLPKVSETPQEAEAILRGWIEEGLQRIFGKYPEDHWDSWPKQVYRERIESEWRILKSKGVIPYFCVPMDTEILTIDGWKSHSEVQVGDLTWGYNKDTRLCEWTPVLEKVQKTDEVFEIGSSWWSVKATAEHRWPTLRRADRKTGARKFEMVSSQDLTPENSVIVSAPSHESPERFEHEIRNAKIVGWMLCDGGFRKARTGNICGGTIVQAKPDKRKILEELLSTVDHVFEFRSAGVNYPVFGYRISAGEVRAIFSSVGLDASGTIERLYSGLDEFVTGLSDSARVAFVDACWHADGSTNRNAVRIHQNDGAIQNAIVLAAHMSGFRTRVLGNDLCKHIVIFKTKLATSRKFVSQGEQEVWCVRTGLGTWTMRQGKQVSLTGNCLIGDVVRWAKSQGIRCGIGRGSAAASLISYLVGIVTIDPIPWNLLFERFLNPERKGLPDIDLDFQSNRRHEVKAYLARRYGQDHVADIITHTTFQPKKVIQDLCRVHDDDITYLEAMAVTDSIEIRQDDEETTLEEILPLNDKLREFAHHYPKIWEHALRLEGAVANNSKHAAGIIVTPRPVHEYMSLERGKAGDLVTSWSDAADFPAVSDHGLVKLDALGLIGLEKHDYACRLIEERHGIKVDLNDLPPLRNPRDVDEEVLAGFREGHTSGIFQFSGVGITALIRDIQPSGSALDLAAANAIYRPGPMKGNVTWEYAKRKNGTSEIVYWHELVTPLLEETYQLICYQEQCMSISKQLGGFSGAEADDLRKAIGKLYRIKGGRAAKDFMNRFESKWYEGCASRGISKQVSKEIWGKILEYGHYGFPRPHAAAYALTAYQDMWLKVKYPAEFYAALFTYEEDEEKRKSALREAKARGIEIVWPDVNYSGAGYTVDQEGRLVLGLASITGIGPRAREQIIQHRPYQNFVQFLERSGRSANTSALIHSGAVDSLAPDTMTGLEFRAYLLSKVKKVGSRSDAEWEVWEHLKHNQKLKSGPREVPLDRKEPSNEYLLHAQAEILGMPLSSYSLSPEDDAFLRGNVHAPDEIHIMAKGAHCIAGGHVTKIVRKKTKKGDDFANVTLEFDAYQWNVKFWQGQLNRFESILQEGRVIMVSGKKDEWNGQVSVIAQQATTLEVLQAEMSSQGDSTCLST